MLIGGVVGGMDLFAFLCSSSFLFIHQSHILMKQKLLARIRTAVSVVCFIALGISAHAVEIKYLGSTPASGSEITSFDDITLHFDISNVANATHIRAIGCYDPNLEKDDPDLIQLIKLYKGEETTAENLLAVQSYGESKGTFYIECEGSDFTFNFNDIEVDPGQIYTIVVEYSFYSRTEANKNVKGEYINFKNDPLILTYTGATNASKVIAIAGSSLSEPIESLSDVKINLNYPVKLTDNASASILEGDVVVATTTSFSLADEQTLNISFPETQLIYNHEYKVQINAGSLALIEDEAVTNKDISVDVAGNSYLYFGAEVTPAEGEITSFGTVKVKYDFPAECGFVWLPTTPVYKLDIYKGSLDGEPVCTVNGALATDGYTLEFPVKAPLDLGCDYYLVIAEDMVKAYIVGAVNYKYKPEYMSERIVRHYTTPEPTHHALTIVGSDGHATKIMVPRKQDVSLEFNAAEGWSVNAVNHNDEAVALDGNAYTISNITVDAVISIEHALATDVKFYDLESAVDDLNIEGTDYTVGVVDSMLIIKKLKGGETVKVYSVGGQLLASHVALDDIVKINLPAGVYIVTINDTAFKVRI